MKRPPLHLAEVTSIGDTYVPVAHHKGLFSQRATDPPRASIVKNLCYGGGKRKVRVLVLEEQPALRLGVWTALQSEDDMEVVGETSDVDEALRLTERLRPDVVVMDLRSSGKESGVEVCRDIKCLPRPPRVVALGEYTSVEEAEFLLRLSGAESCVDKREGLNRFVDVVRRTHVGERVRGSF